jgi:hypothetical protein
MNPDQSCSPLREGEAADHDQPYTWGRHPSIYLAPREVAHLMIFRSRIHDRDTLRNRGRSARARRRTSRRSS